MFVSDLFLYLTKILPLVFYPLGLALLVLLSGLFFRSFWLARVCLMGAFAILWVASMPVVEEWATRTLERTHPAWAAGFAVG